MAYDRQYGEYTFYVEPITANLDETMAMWRAHWAEQSEEELRNGAKLNPHMEGFIAAEQAKNFIYITARKGSEIVGHFGLKFGICRQTSERIAGDDFFYVKPEHRKGMLAYKLIKFARDAAFQCEAAEFTLSHRVSVPSLDVLLRRLGMRHIAHVHTIRR